MSLRVLNNPHAAGALNMAADEALLAHVGEGASPPTLRFYQWHPPTISLGYFQPYREYEIMLPPARGLAVVRRLTGGGAILHDQELTYSLTLPLTHPLLQGGPNRLYALIHDVVIDVLHEAGIEAWRGCPSDESSASRGPFFCFARRHCYDVLIGVDKVAGSAQRRTRFAVLQHGSIILGRRFSQQPTAAIGDHVDWTADELARRCIERFAARTETELIPGEWTAPERGATEALIDKYAGEAWTRLR